MLTNKLKDVLFIRFLLITLIPLIIIAVTIIIILYRHINNDMRISNYSIISTLSSEISEYLSDSQRDLMFITEAVLSDPTHSSNLLDLAIKRYPSLDNIMILDSLGTVEYSKRINDDIGLDMSGQLFYKETVRLNRPYWSPAYISMTTSKVTVSMTFPYKGKIAAAQLDLDKLISIVKRIKIGPKSSIYILDQKGIYIAHINSKMVKQREIDRNFADIKKEIEKGKKGFLIEEYGQNYIMSATPIAAQNWIVVIQVHKDEAMAAVNRIIYIFVAGFLISIAFAFISNFIFNRKLMSAFDVLTYSTQEVKKGNYKLNMKIDSYEEFNDLSYSINTMSEEIERVIGELKNKQKEVNELNSKLEERVIRRTGELRNALLSLDVENNERIKTEKELKLAQKELSFALDKEKELNNMKTKFISMISHEYRTPLTIILSSTYLVERYIENSDYDKCKKHTDRIQNSVRNLILLLEEVLFLGKSDSDKLKVVFEEFDLIELLNETIEEFNLIDNNSHVFVLENYTSNSYIKSDKVLFHQLLTNIISNSIKYSKNNSSIFLRINENNESIDLNIIDKGIGISEENIKQLWEPFYRADNVGNIPGTGLGLSIVRRICHVLKIESQLESELNKGSAFTFKIKKELQ